MYYPTVYDFNDALGKEGIKALGAALDRMFPRIVPATFARRTCDGLAQIGMNRFDLVGARHFALAEGEGGGETPAAPVEGTPPAEPAEPEANTWDGRVESLDPRVQKMITDLRKEAGDNRVKSNTAEDKLNAILTAAGLKDAEDPAKALQSATTERDTAAQERDAAKRELALFKAAQAAGADPNKLLDRTSFMTSIQGLDVSDATALKAAIEAAVKADSTLKAPRAGAASTVDNPAGSGEQGPITEEQLARMTPEQIEKAFREGRLKHLLG